jgi:drug/metabolite transporter (DMT)-like permease
MTDQTLGQLYALASALSFAFASIGISVNQRRGYPNDGAFLSVVITVLFAFGLFVIFERGVLPSTDDPLFMAGLFAMVFGRTLVFRSIKLLGVTRGTTVKKFNPFFSVFFAFLFLSELFSAWEMVGMGALAAALALLVSDKSRKYASQDPLKTHSFGATALLYLPGILACLAYAA